MVAGVLLIALLAGACGGEPPLAPTEARLEVRPAQLEFDRTFVGYPSTARLVVVNGGRVRSSFEATTSAPFSVRPEGTQTVGGTSEEEILVVFSPKHPGIHQGAVTLRLGEESVSIPVQGNAVRPPICGSADPCVRVHFDPVAGVCVEQPLPEGASCDPGNACVEGATCRSGACVGAAVTCEAPNRCFRARCDPEHGCQVDPWNDCPVPENPCKVSRCDPVQGCVEVDREDYSPCGPSQSCKERNLCVSGSCVTVTDLLEGLPCSHPCGDGGSCSEGTCVREGGLTLQASWSRKPEGRVVVPGTIDESGHLHWIECPPDGPCEGVSFTANGFERYRTPLAWDGAGAAPTDVAIVDEGALVWGADGIHLLSLANGSILWGRATDTFAEALAGPCPCEASLVDLVDIGEGTLVGIVEAPGWWGLVGIRASDGAPVWTHGYAGAASERIVSDGAGRAFLVVEAPPSALLVALRADGTPAWESPVDADARVLAVGAGVLAVSSGGRTLGFDLQQGYRLWSEPGAASHAVAVAGAGFTLERDGIPRVTARDWVDGSIKGAFSLAGATDLRPMALLSSSDWEGELRTGAALLVAREGAEEGWWLEGVDDEGEQRFRCEIPDAVPHGERWAFTPSSGDGPRLILSTEDGEIRTFFVPALRTNPLGWSAPRGSFSRAGRPR